MKVYWLNLIRSIVSYIPVLGILLIIMSFPFGYNVFERIGHYMLGTGFVLDYVLNKRWLDWYWSRSKLVYIAMLLIYILMPLWQIWDPTPPTNYFIRLMERYMMFLATGIIGILGFSDKLRLKCIGYAMLLTSCVMSFVNLYLYLSKYGIANFNVEVFNHIRAIHINSHMVVNLYVNTALIIGAYLFKNNTNIWARVLLAITMLIAAGYVLLSVGRVGYVTLLLIVFIYAIYTIWQYRRFRWVIVSFLIVVLSALFLRHNRLGVEEVLRDPRFAVWDYSVRMIKKHPILGYGLSTLSVEYVDGMYEDEKAYNYFVKPVMSQPSFAALKKTMITHHPHNALLMMYLSFGIIGLMLLLFLCTAIALIPTPNLKIYVWLFLLALFVQMQFEPLGDHIQPQFIAILLLCFQKESSHYKSEDSYFNYTPISFFGIFGNSQCSNSQYNKE